MEIFRYFYALDWTSKDAFISGQITVESTKRKFTKKEVSRRQKTRSYRLQDVHGNDHRVCKVFFKSVLDVCDGKITKALQRKSASGTPVSDKRGRHTPHNKTNLEDTNYLKEFIRKFPVYESHYCRHHTTKKYLPPNLNMSLMYAEYKRCCETDKRKISSLFVFRDVFNHSFNLSFHRPQKDTCQKCDHFNIILKTQLDNAEKEKTELEKTLHQRKAEAVKALKKDEINEAKNSEGLKHVAVFDLQRTLPVPALSTSVAYYKRQMWVFNLCIHDKVRNVGHMFIWDESIASRGAQEIVSCLIKYISLLPDTPNKIINLYSDACGGQNRNIKVVLGLLNEMQKNGVGVKEINLKFFVSGHSFSTCDQNFGVIDKEKKYHENIYIPDDWVSVIRNAKKKDPRFTIHKMGKEDFFSTKKLENDIVHRKKTTTGEKVEWLKISWIHLRHSDPKKMYFKLNYNTDSLFSELDLKRRSVRGRPSSNHYIELDLLYPDGKPITEEKKKDLMALLSFVPPIHHGFYKKLKTDNERDLGLADGDPEDGLNVEEGAE